jgi:hypothetical protein
MNVNSYINRNYAGTLPFRRASGVVGPLAQNQPSDKALSLVRPRYNNSKPATAVALTFKTPIGVTKRNQPVENPEDVIHVTTMKSREAACIGRYQKIAEIQWP